MERGRGLAAPPGRGVCVDGPPAGRLLPVPPSEPGSRRRALGDGAGSRVLFTGRPVPDAAFGPTRRDPASFQRRPGIRSGRPGLPSRICAELGCILHSEILDLDAPALGPLSLGAPLAQAPWAGSRACWGPTRPLAVQSRGWGAASCPWAPPTGFRLENWPLGAGGSGR